MRILIIGGGIFGVTAALELRRRQHIVCISDVSEIPAPDAESTDISKIVRLDYGADELYTEWMEVALKRWRAWSQAWGEDLFHETGVAFATAHTMTAGEFEFESRRVLLARGHALESRIPTGLHGMGDGYWNPQGGWAESGRVVARLAAEAGAAGVEIRRGSVTPDVALAQGFDHVVVAAGAWTQRLVPALAGVLRSTAQPVFHLRPCEPALYHPSIFPVFGADISNTGWYGFPLHPSGVVKLANHGAGRSVDPLAPRSVTSEQVEDMWSFVQNTIPSLSRAELVYTRACVYGDTPDGHLWIARDPENPRVTVAAGGSGHAFKFAPVLGEVIADTVEGIAHPMSHRFRWRTDTIAARSAEEARAGR